MYYIQIGKPSFNGLSFKSLHRDIFINFIVPELYELIDPQTFYVRVIKHATILETKSYKTYKIEEISNLKKINYIIKETNIKPKSTIKPKTTIELPNDNEISIIEGEPPIL